eukprot:422368_1
MLFLVCDASSFCSGAISSSESGTCLSVPPPSSSSSHYSSPILLPVIGFAFCPSQCRHALEPLHFLIDSHYPHLYFEHFECDSFLGVIHFCWIWNVGVFFYVWCHV